jgi:hypothetical protein
MTDAAEHPDYDPLVDELQSAGWVSKLIPYGLRGEALLRTLTCPRCERSPVWVTGDHVSVELLCEDCHHKQSWSRSELQGVINEPVETEDG